MSTKNAPTFGGDVYPGALLCPSCDSEYTHQQSVEVYFRDEEDAKKGSCVQVGSRSVRRIPMTNNPSDRRDGLRIHFSCEQCPALFVLDVLQHKGYTFVECYPTGEVEPDTDEEKEFLALIDDVFARTPTTLPTTPGAL